MGDNIELNIEEIEQNKSSEINNIPKLNLDEEIIEKKMKKWLEANENSDELEFERLARINLNRFQVFDNNEKTVILNKLMSTAFSKKKPVQNKTKKQIVPRRNIRNRTRLLKKPFQMKLF
tara:strand:- start:397 stop:756 length:360 start_codon:yes stop_codon:yes gene_type:complete